MDSLITPHTTQRYRIATMDCPAEESEIRRALQPIAGITSLRFDFGHGTLTVVAEAKEQSKEHSREQSKVQAAVMAAIQAVGFDPQPVPDIAAAIGGTARADALDQAHSHASEGGHGHAHAHAHAHSHAAREDPGQGAGMGIFPGGMRRLALALGLAIGAEALSFFAPDTVALKAAGMALALAAIALAGLDTYKKGLAALRRGRLNINALMTVAVTGAFVIGQWPEAAMVMALYAIAELIEARAVDRARGAISALLALAPETAEVRQGDGQWLTQPVAAVALGAVVRVRPGQRVPLDGQITSGSTSVDQSPVTGESLPVDKAMGDTLFAGTINQQGSVEMRVSATAAHSTLARIIQAVEQAQGSRAPTQRFVDRFAAIYTPAVFVLALAVALLGPWLAGWTVLTAVYKALVLLVIGCPCALVIATPVTVVSGLAAAARRGILIKGGAHLEQARGLKAIALDKTGTLTEGKPRLVDWQLLDEATGRDKAERVAAALAGHSDHPVSRAIAAGLAKSSIDPSGFRALSGRGVVALVEGQTYALGNHRMVEERGQSSPAILAALKVHETEGRTVSLLASPSTLIALFAVADTVKPASAAAVAELQALGITPVMLTGDNQTTAEAIARQAGISDVRGNLLPEDKLAAVKQLQQRYGPTAMAGDGINDAPALAQADIGIAMGAAGTDIAMEAADIVVMNDDLRRIAQTVRLSRLTHRVLWQNIALALGIKGVFLLLAVFDNASMWMAVFADMGASLLVVFNGLRLLRFKENS